MPWLPPPLARIFADEWTESGNADLALAAVRAAPEYETYFPGNKRDDGSLFLDEQAYLATIEGYSRQFAEFGLGGNFMQDIYPDLVQAGKSPTELAEQLGQIYIQVISRSDEVREYYANNFGTGQLSDQAIFASALKPDVSPLVFERQFRTAQIGGSASQFGFDLDVDAANRLYSFGLDEEGANRVFSRAAQQLPTLRTLQQRFDDPNDELDIEQFSEALVIQSPRILDTMVRLLNQERAQFTPVVTSLDQLGRVQGLRRFAT